MLLVVIVPDDTVWNLFIKDIVKLKTKDKVSVKPIVSTIAINQNNSHFIDNIVFSSDKENSFLVKADKKGINKAIRQQLRDHTIYDGRIDLHNYSLEQAYDHLKHFLIENYYSNKRKLLIITGKGPLTNNGYQGKIRNELPKWLNIPELRNLILAYDDAPLQSGGKGAIVIILKKI